MKKRRGKKEYSAPTNFKSQLQLVCNILEINSTTPQREVKKVDRKLVILYHPDELTYPNKSQKKSRLRNLEKFKKRIGMQKPNVSLVELHRSYHLKFRHLDIEQRIIYLSLHGISAMHITHF